MAKKKIDEVTKKIIAAIKNSPEVMQTIDSAIKEARDEALETQKEIDQTLSSIGTSRESLIQRTAHLKGKKQYHKLSEIYAAFVHYKDEAPNRKEVIEFVLDKYRKGLAEGGYNFIQKEKQLIPIVEAYGSVKDKVALIVNAHFDMSKDEIEPLLSRNEAEAIKAEIRTQGIEAMEEFMTYLYLTDALRFILQQFYTAKFSFLSSAYQSTIYLHTYEWLGKTEELFNSFASLVDPNKQAEFNQLATEYNSYLQNYQRFGELDEKSGDGWVDEQREDCLSYAQILCTEVCRNRLSQLKGAIEAIEQWTKDNEAELFLPMELRNQIHTLKTETIQELQSKYYSSHLRYMEERGETPTEADRKIALFPGYEEVERKLRTYKYIYYKLDGYKEPHN